MYIYFVNIPHNLQNDWQLVQIHPVKYTAQIPVELL